MKYKAGYKYQLVTYYEIQTGITGESARTLYLSLYKTGKLVINEGYCWDGASGPAIDTMSLMRGSLVHDALYQLIRLGLLGQGNRDKADRLLQRICIEDGMLRIRAWWIYKALRWFGGAATNPKNQKPVITAP